MTMAARTSLAEFQRDFAAALFGAAAAAPAAARPGFAVHRNTVMLACIEALAANYPTVVQLAGAAWFRDAAKVFVPKHLPHEGGLASYGRDFAGFLAGFAPASTLTYLPSVARLDRCWTEAHLAADAPTLTSRALARLAPEALAGAVLVPHPAARWACFDTSPSFTIWRRHREALALDDDLPWRGERALIVRPGETVAWHEIDAAAAAFLTGCARACAFDESIAAAETAAPGAAASLGAWFPALVAAGAFTRVETRPDDNDPAID